MIEYIIFIAKKKLVIYYNKIKSMSVGITISNEEKKNILKWYAFFKKDINVLWYFTHDYNSHNMVLLYTLKNNTIVPYYTSQDTYKELPVLLQNEVLSLNTTTSNIYKLPTGIIDSRMWKIDKCRFRSGDDILLKIHAHVDKTTATIMFVELFLLNIH